MTTQRLLNILVASVGFATLCYAIYSAVCKANPFWYSYFTVGSFLFFDCLDVIFNRDSNLKRLFSKKWRTPVYTYLSYVALAIPLDYLYGRYLGNMWVYPHFDATAIMIHVIIIGYPFGLFSGSALFRVANFIFGRLFSKRKHAPLLGKNCETQIAKLLLLGTILSVSLPIANYFLFNNRWVHELMVICLVIGMASISPITHLMRLPSFLGHILNGDRRTISALLFVIIINAFTHEAPNTYAWEWRYLNWPFTSFEIINVNILVLTVGWSYLTILGISTNELFFQWDSKIEDKRT